MQLFAVTPLASFPTLDFDTLRADRRTTIDKYYRDRYNFGLSLRYL
jgi:hypothetical protein